MKTLLAFFLAFLTLTATSTLLADNCLQCHSGTPPRQPVVTGNCRWWVTPAAAAYYNPQNCGCDVWLTSPSYYPAPTNTAREYLTSPGYYPSPISVGGGYLTSPTYYPVYCPPTNTTGVLIVPHNNPPIVVHPHPAPVGVRLEFEFVFINYQVLTEIRISGAKPGHGLVLEATASLTNPRWVRWEEGKIDIDDRGEGLSRLPYDFRNKIVFWRTRDPNP